MKCSITLAGIFFLAAQTAQAGMCDQPPYAQDPKMYQKFVEVLGRDMVKDMLANICRVKYYNDERLRKAMVDAGVPAYDIDHDDVGLLAIKLLEEAKKCIETHVDPKKC